MMSIDTQLTVDYESRSTRNYVGSSKRSSLVPQFPEIINREPLIEEHADAMVFENKNPYTKPSCHHLTQSQVADMFVPTFI